MTLQDKQAHGIAIRWMLRVRKAEELLRLQLQGVQQPVCKQRQILK